MTVALSRAAEAFETALVLADLPDDDARLMVLHMEPHEVAERVSTLAGRPVTAAHVEAWTWETSGLNACTVPAGRGECGRPGTEQRRGVWRCPEHDKGI